MVHIIHGLVCCIVKNIDNYCSRRVIRRFRDAKSNNSTYNQNYHTDTFEISFIICFMTNSYTKLGFKYCYVIIHCSCLRSIPTGPSRVRSGIHLYARKQLSIQFYWVLNATVVTYPGRASVPDLGPKTIVGDDSFSWFSDAFRPDLKLSDNGSKIGFI
jgi:hypothetical protein